MPISGTTHFLIDCHRFVKLTTMFYLLNNCDMAPVKTVKYMQFLFLKKGNIFLSRRYQLHPAFAPTRCRQDIHNAHSQRKKMKANEKKDPP